jgi:hypothetical protein
MRQFDPPKIPILRYRKIIAFQELTRFEFVESVQLNAIIFLYLKIGILGGSNWRISPTLGKIKGLDLMITAVGFQKEFSSLFEVFFPIL